MLILGLRLAKGIPERVRLLILEIEEYGKSLTGPQSPIIG